MWILRLLLIFLLLVPASEIWAQTLVKRDDLYRLFDRHSVVGTFAMLNSKRNEIVLVGAQRASNRYIPASTFKIINSLIALETGVVADDQEIIPYGGKSQPIKAWEKDMSIRDAIRVSNVPVFQEIARRVGLARYRKLLKRFQFGNQTVGQDVETFWLKGPLKISALAYLSILQKLAAQQLDAKTEHQRSVKEMLRLQRRGDAVLYGKTGWTVAPNPDIGWFVGWVERRGETYPFALNMDINRRADIKLRIKLTKAFLSELDVY